MSRDHGANKVRIDINVTADTKRLLDELRQFELAEDRNHDRPERSKSEILEMVLRKGYRSWKSEQPLAMTA
jgi:hypothetical protein